MKMAAGVFLRSSIFIKVRNGPFADSSKHPPEPCFPYIDMFQQNLSMSRAMIVSTVLVDTVLACVGRAPMVVLMRTPHQ